MYSPVALFVYNRADNTRRTLQHLIRNTQAADTDVYVFSDGGKDGKSWEKVREVRSLLHDMKKEVEQSHAFRSFTIVERPENIYLERNIIKGISYVLERHDTIIVLEDDICTSPFYLEYMNRAFDLYRHEPKVMHVAGFTNLDLLNEHPELVYKDNEVYFTPHMSGWGWGTWRDRWHGHFRHYQSEREALEGMSAADTDAMQYGGVFPCLASLRKNPIPWDICWEIAIYKAGGLCVTPVHTMVRNIGLKNGTHFRAFDILQSFNYDREPLSRPLRLSACRPEKNQETERLFADAIRDWGIRYTFLGRIVRFVYKLVAGKKR
ncbi:MAG: glycosyltransferase [Bacteroides sp.]|nr:glycosyltransferase [Roseburia sp.]MCM1346754.1 glycosyltransferase [Bacteroides sp.]MCM1421309.1 glycosyltransferase [Bacteroides sp.]